MVSGAGYDELCAKLLQRCRRFKRALKIFSDGDEAYVEIPHAHRFQKGAVRAVSDLRVGYERKHFVDPFLAFVHAHDLMPEPVKIDGDMFSEASQPDQQYGFHVVFLLTLR